MPEREAFGEQVASDPAIWSAITRNLQKLTGEGPGNAVAWEADSDVVWFDRHGFLICVGMDGRVSPRLWSQRLGMKPGMMRPFAESAEVKLALAGRKLLAAVPPRPQVATSIPAREGGAMVIDGAPGSDLYEPFMIPQGGDGWRPGSEAIPPHILEVPDQRVKIGRIKHERSLIRIPVKGSGSSERADAITQLAYRIEPGFFDSADDWHIDIVFVEGGKDIREATFFSAIGLGDREWAAPPLRHLIERYLKANVDCRTYFQTNDDGVSVLAQAALRLAELDHGALALVRAYGETIDGGHEYHFAGEIPAAVIKAHGWTSAVIKIVTWVMMRQFYNTYDKVGAIWRGLGLYQAAAAMPPAEYACLVASEFSLDVEGGRLDWSSFAGLRAELGDRAEPWEIDFLDALERSVPGSTLTA